MIKREAKFTVLFRHWVLANPPKYPCALELKQTQKNYINFSEIKEHQIDALLAVKRGEKGLLWKLPDDSRGIKPFDLFYLKYTNAYIVIKYPTCFCIIDIDRFLFIRNDSVKKKKSLNMQEACRIADKTVIL